jgi:glycerate 2-kinase
MAPVRVLVASDTIGALTSRQAGEAIGSGWSGADVRVLPVGDSGTSFLAAYADLLGAPVEGAVDAGHLVSTVAVGRLAALQVSGSAAEPGLKVTASSRPLGTALARMLDPRPQRLVVDLSGLAAHDAGAGLLGALGAVADGPLDAGVEPLGRLTRVDLGPVRDRLADVELIGVVPADQLRQPLLGLRGITSLAGRAAGLDPASLLATDAALERFSHLAAPGVSGEPGAGACGGLGFAVLALGGRLDSGPGLVLTSEAGVRARAGADLMLTGCSVFDFLRRGGGVVAAVAELAAGSLSPCVLIAGEVVVGAREMRAMGIEAAYAVRESALDAPAGEVSEVDLRRTAARVAKSWRW